MTDHAELIERLRNGLPYVVSATVWAECDALKIEAATALDALVAERDRYREALRKIASERVEACCISYVRPYVVQIARAALAQGGEKP